MARNTLAGTKKGKSKTARFYQKNKKSRDKKKSYDTKYHKGAARRAYRSLLNKINRKKKTYGNKDGKDVAHKENGKFFLQKQKDNRADKKKK